MSTPGHAMAIAAGWRARLNGPVSQYAPSVLESPSDDDLVPAVAAFMLTALGATESLLITVPDDVLLPRLSNAIELELRPLCLILPQPAFAARVALRATLALLKARIARLDDSSFSPIWNAQRHRLDIHAATWIAASAWASADTSDDCPVDVSILFPVCILPAARVKTLADHSRDVSLVIHAERMPGDPKQLATYGVRSLLLYGSRTALAPVAEEDLLDVELDLLTQQVGEMELELATMRAELAEFARLYYERVGILIAELDGLEAKIARRLARQRPNDQGIQHDAHKASRKAEQSRQETHRYRESDRQRERAFMPSQALKRLFRQLAQKIHPDRATNETDRVLRTELMSEANRAYRDNDEMALQGILDQWLQQSVDIKRPSHEGTEHTRAHQVAKMQRRLRRIEVELNRLFGSRLYELFAAAGVARKHGRNVIEEMARALVNKIEAAQRDIAESDPLVS